MQPKTKAWLSAARLRTLPLSISGIIVGVAIAGSEGFTDVWLAILCILTTISYAQQLSDTISEKEIRDFLKLSPSAQNSIMNRLSPSQRGRLESELKKRGKDVSPTTKPPFQEKDAKRLREQEGVEKEEVEP